MNLFERFWKSVDEKRDADGGMPDALDLSLTVVHPPEGARSEAARDLTRLVKLAPRRHPPVVASQPSVFDRPFCLVYTVGGNALPEFHQLFEHYVDKNAFLAETLLRLRPHCDIPYVLFIGEKSFFLYDVQTEELLRWGTDFGALSELALDPVVARQDLKRLWDEIPRKTFAQRSEEFGRWLDLWKVSIGARMNAEPAFVQTIMQKVILLFLYDVNFGLVDDDLSLRTNFLAQRIRGKAGRGKAKLPDEEFDGVAWLHQASEEVRDRYQVDFLGWTQPEGNFFALMGADARKQFSHFVLELFLLSQCKFAVPVQADVFSDPDSRLKLWKFSVTETVNVRKRLQADEVNVYEPISVDLEESGLGWALHVIEETLEFWRERCMNFARELTERRRVGVQFDMFQQPNLEEARVPLPDDVFKTTFSTSVRIYYADSPDRATLEYLVILKVFDYCRQWSLPLQPLDHVGDVFVRKESGETAEEL